MIMGFSADAQEDKKEMYVDNTSHVCSCGIQITLWANPTCFDPSFAVMVLLIFPT